MLRFSFSHEALEKALREDELLHHLMANRWMAMTVPSPPDQPQVEQLSAAPARAANPWPRSNSRDW